MYPSDSPENDLFAVGSFLQALPQAADEVRLEDVEWLIAMMRDPDVAGQYTTKLMSSVAENMGSQSIVRPADFLVRLSAVLAVFWERDDLLDPDSPLDAEQAAWLRTLRKLHPENPAPASVPRCWLA